MPFSIRNRDVIHQTEIRIPMPQLRGNQELFKFAGLVHFHGADARDRDAPANTTPLTGVGSMIVGGNYRHIIPEGKAIRPSQWTTFVGSPNFKTNDPDGAGIWAIKNYWIVSHGNNHADSDGNVFIPNGNMSINCDVFLGNNDFLVMINYDITIIGQIVDYETTSPLI